MNRRHFVTSALITPAALLAAPAVIAQEAGHLNATDEWLYDTCGQMWPSRGFFETNASNGVYEVGYNFTYTENQLAALKCVASQFEFRFVIGGFLNADDAQRTSRFESDLRGGGKRSFVYDVDHDVTLRYGLFRPQHMSAGEYSVHLKLWGLETDEQNDPWVAIQMGMSSKDGRTIIQFLSRGQIEDVIRLNNGDAHGYQYLPFGD